MITLRPARPAFIAAALLMALLPGAASAGNFIGEPETLVYGRILNRRNPNVDQVVTEGQLRWTIRKPDGTSVQLSGDVDSLDGGNQSYLLRIPHQAVMLGQTPSALALPLGTTTTTASHVAITLDGQPAAILSPGTSRFDLDQLLRATAIRLDLEIDADAEDSDGDGMPDWWEDLHGLDKQNANDALTDLNGNGTDNLNEFLAGNDPERDSRLPLLLTKEVIAYSGATSIVLLEAADSDSTDDQLVFTLHATPENGRIILRNASSLPGETGMTLAAGATFTQADVRSGRLTYEHAAGETPGPFEVGVMDEDPAHAESSGSVLIRLYDPAPGTTASSASEGLRFEAHRLARESGHLVADLGATAGKHRLSAPSAGMRGADHDAYLLSYGEELPHIFLGGPSDDSLAGGAAGDFLQGGDGADQLAGGGGADTFLYTGSPDLGDVIEDFSPEEGDVIDLAAVLTGSSQLLTDYVRIRRSGADALLEVSASGTGSGFGDLAIRLKDSDLQPAGLLDLYYGGNLETGGIGLPPRLSIAASVAGASENGPADGVFTITREGAAGQPITVNLLVSGNATNGLDYQSIPSSILIPAGQSAVNVTIRPYVDALVEFDEIVRLEIASSASYILGSGHAADIVIEDLKPQIRLETLEELASVEDGSPGAILMRRSGLLSPEVFVQFTLGGTAVNGSDYNYVTPYLTLAAGQTTKVIEFVPKPGVNFGTAEAKTARMTIKPNAAYNVPQPSAGILIVPRKLSYDSWLAEHDLATGGATQPALAEGEAGAGMPILLRYGFSVDPQDPFSPESLARMPKVAVEDGHLMLRFRKKPGVTDLDYKVQYSTDMNEWLAGPGVVEDISAQVAPDDPGAAVFRAKQPVSTLGKAVMRVDLELVDPESND